MGSPTYLRRRRFSFGDLGCLLLAVLLVGAAVALSLVAAVGGAILLGHLAR